MLGPTSVGAPGQATKTPARLSTAQAARMAALNLKYRSALRKSSQVSRRMAITLSAVLSASERIRVWRGRPSSSSATGSLRVALTVRPARSAA